MASTYIYRTLGTPTNAYKGTVSHWIKRSGLGSMGTFAAWDNGGTSSNRAYLNLYNDTLYFYDQPTSTVVQTNRLFRDTSAWYHIVVAWDTSQGTASDRVKIYVNGVQETSMATGNYPSQNSTLQFNTSGRRFSVGSYASSGSASGYYDGLISHFHFVDGSQLAPTVFGSTDSTTGEWKINPAPTYTVGNNGFFWLKDSIATTDHSSNSNTFTVGGGTLTLTVDNPSNVFATWNPLYPSANLTYSNGNNTVTSSSSSWTNGVTTGSTFAISKGKWYWEVKWDNDSSSNGITLGVFETEDSQNNLNNYLGEASSGIGYFLNTNEYYIGGVATSLASSFSQGDIISIALDMDNNYIYFGENGTFLNSGDPTSGSSGTGGIDISSFSGALTPALSTRNNNTLSANFGNGYFGTTAVSSAGTNASGNGIFEYDVPTGYTALSTKGLNL